MNAATACDDVRRLPGQRPERAGKSAVFSTTVPRVDRQDPAGNLLLAALTAADYGQLLPILEPVALPLGRVLHEAGGPRHYAYFPTSSVVVLVNTLRNGASTALAVAGNEGVVEISPFMGSESASYCAVVLGAGHAYRISCTALKQAFERGGKLQYLLLRYAQALMTQMMQTGVCNRFHALDQQLCRLLLLNLDRLPSNRLVLTQELIGQMLGVRREGVTEAAGKLKARGTIQYRRGHIAVIDRAALEASACECYAVVKLEYDRLNPVKLQAAIIPVLQRRQEFTKPLDQIAGNAFAGFH